MYIEKKEINEERPFPKIAEMPWDLPRGTDLMGRGEGEEWMMKVDKSSGNSKSCSGSNPSATLGSKEEDTTKSESSSGCISRSL